MLDQHGSGGWRSRPNVERTHFPKNCQYLLPYFISCVNWQYLLPFFLAVLISNCQYCYIFLWRVFDKTRDVDKTPRLSHSAFPSFTKVFYGDVMPYIWTSHHIHVFPQAAVCLMFIPFSFSFGARFPRCGREIVGHPSVGEWKMRKRKNCLGLKFYAGLTCVRGLFRFHNVSIFHSGPRVIHWRQSLDLLKFYKKRKERKKSTQSYNN